MAEAVLAAAGLGALAALGFGFGRAAVGATSAILLGVLLVVGGTVVGLALDAPAPVAFAVAGPWLSGRELRRRRQLVAELEERTRALREEERALVELSVRRERARIARDLHDLVAHALAVVAVQAGAGRVSTADDDDAVDRRLRLIAGAGADALEELDQLVPLLEAEPAVDWRRRLEALASRARTAGLDVAVSAPPRIPDHLAGAAHRLVQEALTNAVKHAPAGCVRIDVRDGPDGTRIEVQDDGGRAPAPLAATGSGAGLAGMRERVAALGGDLTAGPRAGGGWSVVAQLPPQG